MEEPTLLQNARLLIDRLKELGTVGANLLNQVQQLEENQQKNADAEAENENEEGTSYNNQTQHAEAPTVNGQFGKTQTENAFLNHVLIEDQELNEYIAIYEKAMGFIMQKLQKQSATLFLSQDELQLCLLRIINKQKSQIDEMVNVIKHIARSRITSKDEQPTDKIRELELENYKIKQILGVAIGLLKNGNCSENECDNVKAVAKSTQTNEAVDVNIQTDRLQEKNSMMRERCSVTESTLDIGGGSSC